MLRRYITTPAAAPAHPIPAINPAVACVLNPVSEVVFPVVAPVAVLVGVASRVVVAVACARSSAIEDVMNGPTGVVTSGVAAGVVQASTDDEETYETLLEDD